MNRYKIILCVLLVPLVAVACGTAQVPPTVQPSTVTSVSPSLTIAPVTPTVSTPPTAAASSTASSTSGDPARGKQLFATLPCNSCHDVTKPWPGGDICPNLGNIATEAARIVKSPDYHGKATDAAGYIRESIMNPNAYIVPGSQYRTPTGESVMPKNFAQTLKPDQIDDLVAYLMTLK